MECMPELGSRWLPWFLKILIPEKPKISQGDRTCWDHMPSLHENYITAFLVEKILSFVENYLINSLVWRMVHLLALPVSATAFLL
jgi:hypothetical protein